MARLSKSKRSLSGKVRQLPNFNPFALPFHVWEWILLLVVKDHATHYESCSTKTFPRFVDKWTKHYFTSNDDWKQLRLVCRMFAQIVDPEWKPHVRAGCRADIIASTNITTLEISTDCGDWAGEDSVGLFGVDQMLANATRSVTTLSIYEAFAKKGFWFVNTLLNFPGYFPHLQSLSISSGCKVSSDFWHRLELAFPNLKALAVTVPIHVAGSISLRKLEIAHLALSHPLRADLPALRHCSLDGPYHLCEQFLRGNRRSLISLLFHGPIPAIQLEGDFWQQYPNLQLFGGKTRYIVTMGSPPSWSELNHLSLLYVEQVDPKVLANTLKRFPGIRYLSLGSQAEANEKMSPVWNVCRANNITCYDLKYANYTESMLYKSPGLLSSIFRKS